MQHSMFIYSMYTEIYSDFITNSVIVTMSLAISNNVAVQIHAINFYANYAKLNDKYI